MGQSDADQGVEWGYFPEGTFEMHHPGSWEKAKNPLSFSIQGDGV